MKLGIFVVVILASTAYCMPKNADVFSTEELNRYFGVQDHGQAPDYEVVYPQVFDKDSKSSVGISAIAASTLVLEVAAFDETLVLSVTHDDSNYAPGLQAEHVDDEGRIVMVPVRTDCVYTGKVDGEEDSLVSVTTCEGLMAVIFRKSGALYIEPLDDEHAMKRDISRGFPHVAYKNMPTTNGAFCQTADIPTLPYDDVQPALSTYRNTNSGNVDTKAVKYVELAFISDSAVASSRGTAKATTCVSTLFNAVKNVLQLGSLDGTQLVPKLVHVKIFGANEAGLSSSTVGSTYIYTCASWQYDNNYPIADTKHWDNGVFLTGVDIKQSAGGAELLGIAYLDRCGTYGASLAEFRSLHSTAVTAHEIGHNLGIYHDGSGPSGEPVNTCPISGYLMAPSVAHHQSDMAWSSCSKSYYYTRLTKTTCYDDAS